MSVNSVHLKQHTLVLETQRKRKKKNGCDCVMGVTMSEAHFVYICVSARKVLGCTGDRIEPAIMKTNGDL